MKKIFTFLLTAVTLIGLSSCNKNNPQVPLQDDQDAPMGRLTLHIGVPDEGTKSASTERVDNQINYVQVLVFNGNNLETSRYEDLHNTPKTNGETELSITTRTGNKTVYAILNAPRLNVLTLSALESSLSDLAQNSPTNLVMSGKQTVEVAKFDANAVPAQNAQTVNIFVKRLAAMIQLDAVTVNFNGTSLEGGSFNITEIYLKNVVGKAPYGVSGASTGNTTTGLPIELSDSDLSNAAYWYNFNTKKSGAPGVTVDGFATNCNVIGTPTSLDRDLFAYPNKSDSDATSESFSPRYTRLVIHALINVPASYRSEALDNKDSYYVFDLPKLAANKIYKISNINITMLGKDNDNSDEKTPVGSIRPVIKVDEWSDTVTLNYEM